MRFYLNNKLIGVQEFYNRYLPVVIKQLKEYINKNFKALPQKDYWSQRWFHGFYCFSASLAKIKRGRRKKDFVMFWDKNDPKDILAGRKQLDYDEDDDDDEEEAELKRMEAERDDSRGRVSARNAENAAFFAQLVVVERIRRNHGCERVHCRS